MVSYVLSVPEVLLLPNLNDWKDQTKDIPIIILMRYKYDLGSVLSFNKLDKQMKV